MRRLFWLAMGITIGALVVRKLSRAAEKMTPGGIAASLADALRDVAEAIERGRAAIPMFTTHALVVRLTDGDERVWEHLTNHQIAPAAEAIGRALEDL